MYCNYCNGFTNNPKFCGKSCAAKYNNQLRLLNQNTKDKIAKSLSKPYDHDKLIELIDNFYSVSNIAKELKLGETTIRKILKDNNLSIKKKIKEVKPDTVHKTIRNLSNATHCEEHGMEYKYSSGRKYCTRCNTEAVTKTRTNRKIEAVIYKGGKCERCSYDRCLSSLEFHHTDPSQKDFEISNVNKTSFDVLKPELDKCILVCSNCHREIHTELRNDGVLPDWKKKMGE